MTSILSKWKGFFIYLTKNQRNETKWGRWCLPSFNDNCDQLLKGKYADHDNSLCSGEGLRMEKSIFHESNLEAIDPWQNPTLVTFIDSYGF